MNKVDCFDSKTDKYKNSDAEEGNVIKNGDNDTGYRKSFYGEVQEGNQRGDTEGEECART